MEFFDKWIYTKHNRFKQKIKKEYGDFIKYNPADAWDGPINGNYNKCNETQFDFDQKYQISKPNYQNYNWWNL